jgi:aspartate ammonia-lyase
MSRDDVDKQLSPARLSGLEASTRAIPVITATGDVDGN